MPDVKAEASKDPWALRDDFLAEIDIESIADAVTSYASAAGEASDAADLARLAGEESTDAATYDGGISLSNSEQRLADTLDDLAPGSISDTVAILHKTVQLADATVEDVNAEIGRPPNGLNSKIRDHSNDAVTEANLWIDAYNEAIKPFQEIIEEDSAATHPVISVPKPGGSTVSLLPGSVDAVMDVNGGYGLPDWVFTDIRRHFLDKAVEDAETAADTIDMYIEDYRADLTRLGAELDAGGYDLGNSPLGLWHTPGMAEYHAAELERAIAALEANPDDAEALETLGNVSTVMGSLADSLFDSRGYPVRELTEDELAYLEAIFTHLDADDLVSLGNLDVPGISDIHADVANAIQVMANPDVGGIVPSRDSIPQSVADFVYFDAYDHPGPYDAELERFDAFGTIMGNATLASGVEFSRQMGETAINMQALAGPVADQNGYNGSNGMLLATSLNTLASAELVADEDLYRRLVGSDWQDSSGAAALITSGTTLPPGISQESDAARPYIDAAYRVLSNADRVYLGGEGAENSDMISAVGDTAINYMELVARSGRDDTTGIFDGMRDIYGSEAPYTFDLSESEVQDLFTLMNRDDDVRDDFRTGVAEWQYAAAQTAFGSGSETFLGEVLSDIGAIEGNIAAADIRAANEGIDPKKLRDTTLGAANAVAGLSSNPAVVLGTFGATEVLKAVYDPPPRDQEIVWSSIDGPVAARFAVAQAAVDAGVVDSGPLPPIDGSSTHMGDLHAQMTGIEVAVGYAGVIEGNFDDRWMKEVLGK